MQHAPDWISRRRLLTAIGAGIFALGATPQKGKKRMTPVVSGDEYRLQAFYATEAKYHPDPVPTPLDRGAAVAFVIARVTPTTPPPKIRKLVRLAVFYDLRETAGAFAGLLRGGETQPGDITRSALCLVAIAWIGDSGQQAAGIQYYQGLQNRANVDLHRDVMLEVVEAFGPALGTAYLRQWLQGAIQSLEQRLKQEQTANNVRGIKLLEEKINTLTEFMNIQLGRVDRTFSLRQRIDAQAPQGRVVPLVTLAVAETPEATPPLSYWASMRLIRLAAEAREPIATEFLRRAASLTRPGQELYRARALRAALFFGQPLPEPDRAWLSGQEDAGADPLVLRPGYYLPK